MNQPFNGFGPPSGYPGAPQQQQLPFNAPAQGPQSAPTQAGFGPPPGYGQPQGAPQGGYGQPQGGFGPPQGAPQGGYGQPQGGFGPPQGAPQGGYGQPQSVPQNGYGQPQGAPQGGYGPPQGYGPQGGFGPPQGYGQQTFGFVPPAPVPSNPFFSLNGADPTGVSYPYLEDGTYVLNIDRIQVRPSRKGKLLYIIEIIVAQSTNPSRPAGMKCSAFIDLSNEDMRDKHMKQFIAAALGSDPQLEVHKGPVAPDGRAWDQNAVESYAENQPWKGRSIGCRVTTVETKKGDDFTRHDWIPTAMVAQEFDKIRANAPRYNGGAPAGAAPAGYGGAPAGAAPAGYGGAPAGAAPAGYGGAPAGAAPAGYGPQQGGAGYGAPQSAPAGYGAAPQGAPAGAPAPQPGWPNWSGR